MYVFSIVETGPHCSSYYNADGAVAYGDDLWQAFDRLETLEHTAKIAILAKMLGGAVDLPADAIEKLINIREKAGYLTDAARCQSCGYLHDTGIVCGGPKISSAKPTSNGAKVALTRRSIHVSSPNRIGGRQVQRCIFHIPDKTMMPGFSGKYLLRPNPVMRNIYITNFI